MGQGKGSKAVLSIYKARRDAGWCCLVCFKVAFYIHVQKRVLPLHPHLLISVSLHALTLAALLAFASPLSFAFGSFIGLRPLLMLGPPRNRACRAVNAAGLFSGTVLCIGITSVFNLILISVRYSS